MEPLLVVIFELLVRYTPYRNSIAKFSKNPAPLMVIFPESKFLISAPLIRLTPLSLPAIAPGAGTALRKIAPEPVVLTIAPFNDIAEKLP